jgi:hypothetical protein
MGCIKKVPPGTESGSTYCLSFRLADRPLTILLACTLTFCCSHLIAQQRDRTLDWRSVLNWLPIDTQTLIIAPQPFVIPKNAEDADNETSPVDALRRFALGRLDEFPKLGEALAGHTVKFALSGVREFRGFSGLGLVPYNGCAVIVFSEPIAASLQSAISGLPQEDWSGVTIIKLSAVRSGSLRASPEQVNLFVAQLGRDVLITATDRDLLHSLLDRRAGFQPGRAIPRDLPEWRKVDVTAAAWAIRHFKHSYDSKTDHPQAVGIAYNAQPAGPAQKVYYLSHNQQVTEIIREYWQWPDEGLAPPKVLRKSQGVVEITVPTPSAHAATLFALLLLGSLGYMIAL